MTKRKTQTMAIPAEWLQPHRERFLKNLSDQGYTSGTLRIYGGSATLLCQEVSRRGLEPGELIGHTLAKVRAAVLDGMHLNTRTYKRFCLDRFIDALVEANVAEPSEPPQQVPTELERLRAEYEIYLREQRGLAKATIYHCSRFLDRFMAFRFGATLGNLDDITPRDIVAFLRKVMSRPKPYRDRRPPTHLRGLFRFLFWSGKTKRDLASSLPCVARPRDTHLPRSLKPEEIDRGTDATWSADAVGRRNYAMLLVLARLGLRAPEVIAIQLDDIDWRAGTILIRGKGKRHDRMPLPEDAGKAIVDYIRNGRRGASARCSSPTRSRTGRSSMRRSSIRSFVLPSSRPASSHRRSTSARICCGTAWQPTCYARVRRSTRSATCCVIARGRRRSSTPSTMSKVCGQSLAIGRLREVAHDHPVTMSRRLSRRAPEPRVRSVLLGPGVARLHGIR